MPLTNRESNVSSPENELTAEEDADYEEEVEYVVLDLGNIEPTLVPSSSTYRLIGLDTPTPFLQLSGTILRGRHDNLLGSELIFTDDKGLVLVTSSTDSSSTLSGQKKRSVTHVSTTSKRIAFKEVQLRPKEKASTPAPAQTIIHTGRSVGPEEERLEDDDINDALEYVDMNIDPILWEPQPQLRAGPSRSTFSSVPPSISIPPSRSPSPSAFDPTAALTSFSSFISVSTDEDMPPDNSSSVADAKEASSDPALRIDRLAGASPPLTRAPRGSNKAPAASSTVTASGKRSKAVAKGKQKAKADMGVDGSGMDTNEG